MTENITPAYAPALPWHRRTVFRRIVKGMILLGGAAAVYFGGPVAWRRMECMYWVRVCEGYILPVGFVVYEKDADKAKGLLASSGGYVRAGPGGDFHPGSDQAAWLPACWKKLDLILEEPHSGPYWRQFPPIVFCHQRISAQGVRRLVVVQYDGASVSWRSMASDAGYDFRGETFDPSTFLTPKSSGWAVHVLAPLVDRVGDRPFPDITRIYAGQPDPTDEARFDVDYEVGGVRKTFHMKLANDGKSVAVE